MDKNYKIICGSNIESLKEIPDNYFDSVVTDPPYGLGKEPDAAEMLKAWVETGYLEITGKGFMGKCYSEDTEILTENGWVFMCDIVNNKISNKVYTLNPNTREIFLSNIVAYQKYKYKGDLLNFVGRSVDLLVTPNHNMVVESLKTGKLSMVEAQKLPKSSIFINSGNWLNGEDSEFINIENVNYSIKDFMFFFGIFIGDGCVVNRKSHKHKQNFISIAAINITKRKEIIKCIERLNLKHNTTSSKQIYIYDKNIIKYFNQFGKASDKFIPNEFFKYNSDILNNLLDGLMITDGHKKNKLFQYFTISKKLKDDFQRLIFLCGRSSTINKIKYGGKKFVNKVLCNTQNGYTITVLKEKKKLYFEKIDHKSNKKRLLNVKYDGFVYDITAEENHILYVRRNGKCLWSSNSWDAFVPQPLFWKEVFRVLKPGGHIVAFYGTRTYDWGVMAMRFSGFEVRDCIQWLYGSGFPKSFNVAKKIDEIQGNEREIIGIDNNPERFKNYKEQDGVERKNFNDKITIGNSIYEGLGTALKPAVEPIVLARKPLEKGLSIAENVIKWGTGAINIDGCRISTSDINGLKKNWDRKKSEQKNAIYEGNWKNIDLNNYAPEGRFPANLIISHHPDCCFNGVKKIGSGEKKYHEDGDTTTASDGWHNNNKSMFTHKNADVIASYGEETVEDWTCVDGCPIKIMDEQSGESYGDKGGASRFFYTAKTSKSEKNFGLENFDEKELRGGGGRSNDGYDRENEDEERLRKLATAYGAVKAVKSNFHPTVKPVKLMQYLARLITPPNGKVLDPFNGSGTTGIACVLEGFEYTGLELDEEYCKISEARISAWNEIEEYEDYKKIIESQVPEEEINKYGKQTDLFSE